MKLSLLFFFILSIYFSAGAAVIEGTVYDNDSVPLPLATVYVKSSTYGISANSEGNYFMELKSGTYTLVYSYLGFKQSEKTVKLKPGEHLKLNIVLQKLSANIDEIEIVADKIDRAKSILDKTRKNRPIYLDNIKNYSAETYVKTSISKETFAADTAKNKKSSSNSIAEYYQKENLNLIEYIAQSYYRAPSDFKEEVKAFHDYSEQRAPGGRSISVSVDIEQHDIAPQNFAADNPYIFYNGNAQGDFNFYRNFPDFKDLCKQPLKSPIGFNSGANYKFVFVESFFEDGHKINKIEVIPRLKTEALFYGNIFIEDSTWALRSVNLSVNEAALVMYADFNITQHFERIAEGVYLPNKIDINYTIKDGKTNILGNTKVEHHNYKVNTPLDSKLFNNEIKTYSPDAFDKDSLFWASNRPVALKPAELKFINTTDSVKAYYTSDKYLDKQDSLFNIIDFWAPLAGIGYKNHYSGIEMHVGGLLEQVVPFGVGGYRHRLPFYIKKELANGMMAETRQRLDYGFNNRDFKGKVGVGLTYYQKKFVRTFIEVGNTYELVNNYASIEQTFSRSNYVNEKSIAIQQNMEIANGLFAELNLSYAEKNPITEITLTKWSGKLFGKLNEPIDFERYLKTEASLELKYRLNQKYVIKNNKKIIIGDNYPEITLLYRKGFPDIFGSEVNFDYLELAGKMELELGRLGVSRGRASVGSFISKENLRILEHKYFRGSDMYFFSDPLQSFQLMGPTLNTNGAFLQASYIHHFNGFLMNKFPGNRYMKLSLAGGAGTLSIPEQNFYHAEIFAGLERSVRIKKQLLRLGVYAVTADNTLSKADFTIKFGLSFWDAYSKKWGY